VNEYSVISHNFCNSTNSSWPFSLGQRGAGSDPSSTYEHASKMIVENNYLKDGDGSVQIFIRVDADQSRFSRNVCEQKVSGANNIVCGHFGLRDPWPVVGHHRADSNILLDTTSHNSNSNSNSSTVKFAIGSDNRAHDNIVWAPKSGNDQAVEGVGTCAPGGCSGNRNTSDFKKFPFVSADPKKLDDYKLRRDAL
jgi:hypothetical protein